MRFDVMLSADGRTGHEFTVDAADERAAVEAARVRFAGKLGDLGRGLSAAVGYCVRTRAEVLVVQRDVLPEWIQVGGQRFDLERR